MARIADPLRLYHGTLRSAAEAAVDNDFEAPAVGDRLQALADCYGVGYAELPRGQPRYPMGRFGLLTER